MKLTVSAPGKLILAGEHAVVYGYPAVVAATNRRFELTLKLTESNIPELLACHETSALDILSTWQTILSDQLTATSAIPVGSGMGSSAALSVCVAAIQWSLRHQVSTELDLSAINEAAYQFEKVFHGSPSGVDNTIATFGGWRWYRKESESLKVSLPLNPTQTLPTLWIWNSGKPSETTGEMVAQVRQARTENSERLDSHFRTIEALSRQWLEILQGQKAPESLPELLNANQTELESLGVVSPSVANALGSLRNIGGAGKVCGAGGVTTSSGIALLFHQDPEALQAWAQENTQNIESITLGASGVSLKIDYNQLV